MDYHVRYIHSADGATIAAARGGKGPTVVVSPAFGTSLEASWSRYADAFAGHEVVTWDRRGFGLSERGLTGTDPEAFLADAQAVLDGLDTESCAVVGTLMGTVEASALAARNPGRVTRLVLRAPVTTLADWATIPGVVAARAALEHDWEFFTEAFCQFVVGWGSPGAPASAATLRAITSPDDLTAMFEAFIDLDLEPEYRAIRVPTLVEHHPGYFFPDSYSRRIASMIEDCELVVYAGPGQEFMGDFALAGEFLAEDEPDLAAGAGAHTIMFTDMAASTALTQRLGDDAAQQVVRDHDAAVHAALDAHGGRRVKHTGDGIMASFGSAASAVAAAIEIQQSVTERDLGVRIGLNTGEPIIEGGDLFGTAVQLAARIVDYAAPGQVLVSNVVRELCAGKQIAFEAVGSVTPKGFEEPVALFQVRARTPHHR